MPGRVVSRRQFAEFTRPSGRGGSGPLRVVFVAHPESGQVGVAYALSRKVGNAVQRNRIRRRLRSVVDGLSPSPLAGIYLIKCANGTKDLTYDELTHHLSAAIRRANAI